MRCCSNPECGQPIGQAFGFVKAGDWLACSSGKIEESQVRELCARCGLLVALLEDSDQDEAFLIKIGWHLPVPQLLLPAPA